MVFTSEIMLVFHLLTAVILSIAIWLYFKIARALNIVDRPNERSSHDYLTIRGGGIVFVLAGLLWCLYTVSLPISMIGLFILAAISFGDDIRPLPRWLRFSVQFLAVVLLLSDLSLWHQPWYILILILLAAVYWINAFNFMDGINGITAFYSLVSLGTFWYLNYKLEFMPEVLIPTMIIAVIIFSYFNVRQRAITFAGDVGSISMAFLLTWMMIALIHKTHRPEFLLFFAVYGIDTAITILIRLTRGENIFQAHRSHLYQLLSNQLKYSHLHVAFFYGLIQLIINLLVIAAFQLDFLRSYMLIPSAVLLNSMYVIIRLKVEHRISSERGK